MHPTTLRFDGERVASAPSRNVSRGIARNSHSRLRSRSMRRGWGRLGLFVLAVAGLVAVVTLATSAEETTAWVIAAEVLFIAGMSYLITFLVWPRRSPVSPAHPSVNGVRRPVPDEQSPETDKRPVLVIGNRPAGSAPGSRVHMRDLPTARATRGRKPGERQPTGELRWPAQR